MVSRQIGTFKHHETIVRFLEENFPKWEELHYFDPKDQKRKLNEDAIDKLFFETRGVARNIWLYVKGLPFETADFTALPNTIDEAILKAFRKKYPVRQHYNHEDDCLWDPPTFSRVELDKVHQTGADINTYRLLRNSISQILTHQNRRMPSFSEWPTEIRCSRCKGTTTLFSFLKFLGKFL